MDLVDLCQDDVTLILDSSHHYHHTQDRSTSESELSDLIAMKSVLWDFEDALLNDGCLGIAILNADIPYEVQLEEHKNIIIYGDYDLGQLDTLRNHGINEIPDMRFITDHEHVHSSSDDLYSKYQEMQKALSCETSVEM